MYCQYYIMIFLLVLSGLYRICRTNKWITIISIFYSNGETLTHLLKASLGTGILAMPQAFQCSGLITGIFATVFVSFVCTFCSYSLVSARNII